MDIGVAGGGCVGSESGRFWDNGGGGARQQCHLLAGVLPGRRGGQGRGRDRFHQPVGFGGQHGYSRVDRSRIDKRVQRVRCYCFGKRLFRRERRVPSRVSNRPPSAQPGLVRGRIGPVPTRGRGMGAPQGSPAVSLRRRNRGGNRLRSEQPGHRPPNPITSLSGTAPFSDQPIATLVFDRWTPALSAADASATEGHSVQFRVTLDRRGSTDPVTVDYSTSGGTATEDADYTAAAGTLTFSSGQTTQTVSVETAVDTEVEDDEEYFTLTLRNPTGARLLDEEATGAIVDANNHPPRFAESPIIREVRENLPAGADFGEPVTATDREGGLPIPSAATTPTCSASIAVPGS